AAHADVQLDRGSPAIQGWHRHHLDSQAQRNVSDCPVNRPVANRTCVATDARRTVGGNQIGRQPTNVREKAVVTGFSTPGSRNAWRRVRLLDSEWSSSLGRAAEIFPRGVPGLRADCAANLPGFHITPLKMNAAIPS